MGSQDSPLEESHALTCQEGREERADSRLTSSRLFHDLFVHHILSQGNAQSCLLSNTTQLFPRSSFMTMGRAPPWDAEVAWTWVQKHPLLAYAQVVHRKQPRGLITACPHHSQHPRYTKSSCGPACPALWLCNKVRWRLGEWASMWTKETCLSRQQQQ